MSTTVGDVMSHPPVTCLSSDTSDVPARLMWHYDCGAIVVVHADGRLAGMVTDRDLCMAALTQGRPLTAIPVSTAMAMHPVTVRSADTLDTAQDLLRHHRLRRLPVIDDTGRPVAVVSLSDLARWVERAHHADTDRQLARTLAAICRPH